MSLRDAMREVYTPTPRCQVFCEYFEPAGSKCVKERRHICRKTIAGSFSLKERDCEQSGYLLLFGNIEIVQSVPELTEVDRRRVCSENAVPD
jgi:hypothetical protein